MRVPPKAGGSHMNQLQWRDDFGCQKAETKLGCDKADVYYWVYTRKNGKVVAEYRIGGATIETVPDCGSIEQAKQECQNHYRVMISGMALGMVIL